MAKSKPTYIQLEKRIHELEREVRGKKEAYDTIIKRNDQKTREFESYKSTADLLELYLDEEWHIISNSNSFMLLTENIVGLRIRKEHVRNFLKDGDFDKIQEYLNKLDEIKKLPYEKSGAWELKYKGPSDSEKIGKDWMPFSFSGINQWKIKNGRIFHRPDLKNEEDCYLMTAQEYGSAEKDVKVVFKVRTSKNKELIRDLSFVLSGASSEVGIHPDLVGYTVCSGSKENTEGRIQKTGISLVVFREELEPYTEYQMTIERTGGRITRELINLNNGEKGRYLEAIDTNAIYDKQNHIGFTTFSGEAEIYGVELFTRKSLFSIDQFKIPFDAEVEIRDEKLESKVFKLRIGKYATAGESINLLLFEDITERKRIEKTLRTSEERYRILAENVAEGVAILQDRKLKFVNNSFASLFGYSRDQLVGIEPIILFREDHRKYFQELLEAFEKEIHVVSLQAPCIRKNGEEIWIEECHNFIQWEGKPAVLFTLRDVSETKSRSMLIEEEKKNLQRENIKLKETLKDRYKFGNIIGKSTQMQKIYEMILQTSSNNANVVITGESGTGKDLIARTIHDMSSRSSQPFVVVNCGAIPETLFESEFFGHRKGAFTGAHKDKHGFFDLAHKGSLFLDELEALSLSQQVKLLRAIELGRYTPVGSNRIKMSDTRIIGATNRNLMDMVKHGLMREDFFYRINVISIKVPSLRERKEDIPLLIDNFINEYCSEEKETVTFSPGIMSALCNYQWPGNVRELQNVLFRYIAVKRFDLIDTSDFALKGLDDSLMEELDLENLDLNVATKNFQKKVMLKALEQAHWHKSKASSLLNIGRRTLFRKMKENGLL